MDMTPNFEGLFYLSLGFSAFSILLLGFRVISNEMNPDEVDEDTNSNEWHSKEQLEIVEIIEETHDIKSFRFKRANLKKIPPFCPGQFLSFQIGDDEKTLRSYSISTSASFHQSIQVSIKKLEGGVGSNWFHNLKVGEKVTAYPPSGLFSDANTSADVERIYIAGGIGITPMVSMILSNIDATNNAKMSLFYGVRSQQDMAFHNLLKYLDHRYPCFSYFPVVSAKEDLWEGEKGRITKDFIKSKTALNASKMIYMCGPTPMMEALETSFEQESIPADKIHSEKFASPTSFDKDQISHQQATLTLNGTAHKYSGKQTILEFFEEKQQLIPYACRVGVCGTCKCKVKGQVHQITDSGLTNSEKRAGMILSCVSFPLEDLEIEV